MVRQLVKVINGQMVKARVPPKPPPKVPSKALMPMPPRGPPPAHAIVLTKAKGGGFAGTEEEQQAIANREKHEKPPTPRVVPPTEPLPDYVRSGNVQSALHGIIQSRQQGVKASGLPPLPPKAPPAIGGGLSSMAKPAITHDFQPEEKPQRPVPEWVVKASNYSCQFFSVIIALQSIGVQIVYGSYLPQRWVAAAKAATFFGLFISLGLFESIKCLICTCVALVKHETVRRQAEKDAARTRMALKQQRQLERRSRSRPMLTATDMVNFKPPPPLMG